MQIITWTITIVNGTYTRNNIRFGTIKLQIAK